MCIVISRKSAFKSITNRLISLTIWWVHLSCPPDGDWSHVSNFFNLFIGNFLYNPFSFINSNICFLFDGAICFSLNTETVFAYTCMVAWCFKYVSSNSISWGSAVWALELLGDGGGVELAGMSSKPWLGLGLWWSVSTVSSGNLLSVLLDFFDTTL